MRGIAIAARASIPSCSAMNPRAQRALDVLLRGDPQKPKGQSKMTTTSIKLTTAAAAITSLFFVMSAPAAYADDYCITGGAQAGHGCGYPSMETCRAAAAGISGSCSLAAGSSTTSPNNANAMAQSRKHPKAPVANRNQAVGN